MKNLFAAVVAVVALSAVPASAQDSGTTASGSYGQSKRHKTNGSAQAEVGERAPGDASSSTSAEGRPRAGIEVGTASATQGGRTDNGTPPGHTSANDRSAPGTNPSQPEDQASTANNSANRAQRQGATEDQEFNRIPGQDATMMTKDQQKKEASAAKKRGAARKDSSIARSKGSDAPNPDADKSTTGNRKE
jgi:hypothetical protein